MSSTLAGYSCSTGCLGARTRFMGLTSPELSASSQVQNALAAR